jgi:hypothetical protein
MFNGIQGKYLQILCKVMLFSMFIRDFSRINCHQANGVRRTTKRAMESILHISRLDVLYHNSSSLYFTNQPNVLAFQVKARHKEFQQPSRRYVELKHQELISKLNLRIKNIKFLVFTATKLFKTIFLFVNKLTTLLSYCYLPHPWLINYTTCLSFYVGVIVVSCNSMYVYLSNKLHIRQHYSGPLKLDAKYW